MIIKYLVTVGGATQYQAWINAPYVPFVVDGHRYRLNLNTNSVDRLVLQDLNTTTVDFSTQYSADSLRDNFA